MQKAQDILDKIFENYPRDFNIRLWNGHLIKSSKQPKFLLGFNDKAIFRKILLRGDAFTAGTAYIEGKIDIEGDIFEAIKLGDYLVSLKLSRRDKLRILLKLLTL